MSDQWRAILRFRIVQSFWEGGVRKFGSWTSPLSRAENLRNRICLYIQNDGYKAFEKRDLAKIEIVRCKYEKAVHTIEILSGLKAKDRNRVIRDIRRAYSKARNGVKEGVLTIPLNDKPGAQRNRRSRPIRGASLVTAKEAAKRNRSLGFGPGDKPGGFGFDPPSDKAHPSYTHSERVRDATKLFITQCVRAYMENKRTAAHPAPTKILASEIQRAGGNIKWL